MSDVKKLSLTRETLLPMDGISESQVLGGVETRQTMSLPTETTITTGTTVLGGPRERPTTCSFGTSGEPDLCVP